jgi:hypothetical protein
MEAKSFASLIFSKTEKTELQNKTILPKSIKDASKQTDCAINVESY